MLHTIIRLDKLAALHRRFRQNGMLIGRTAANFSLGDGSSGDDEEMVRINEDAGLEVKRQGTEHMDDAGPESGLHSLSSIMIGATPGMFLNLFLTWWCNLNSSELFPSYLLERHYPRDLHQLAKYINEPNFPSQFKKFLYSRQHPNRPIPDDIEFCVKFSGKIHVSHSAITRFYAPSDLCGPCGMYRQRIRCNPLWHGQPQHDTVFIVQDAAWEEPRMQGMLIAQIHLLFSFMDSNSKTVQCALISWFLPVSNDRDPDTNMWAFKPKGIQHHQPIQVIPLKGIVRGAHLLPKYGVGLLPNSVTYINALDMFQVYFVNPYIDHHCHKFLSD